MGFFLNLSKILTVQLPQRGHWASKDEKAQQENPAVLFRFQIKAGQIAISGAIGFE